MDAIQPSSYSWLKTVISEYNDRRIRQGVSARYISELLGHSQVSFTMQTYAHVLPEVQREVATKMDEILAPKPVATRVATKPVSEQIA
jgi:integrase